MKKKVVLKISGEAFCDTNSKYNTIWLQNIVTVIKKSLNNFHISIVVGGGNIWRKEDISIEQINQNDSDYLGMLATIMNGVVLKNFFLSNKIPSTLYSEVDITKVVPSFNYQKVEKDFSENKVCIFCAGIGHPFFSTDTNTILKALEIGADLVIFGKNNVDGVYDKDPQKFLDAKKYDLISLTEIIDKKLKIIDLTAASLALKGNFEIFFLNINKPENLENFFFSKKVSFTKVINKG
ncbi:UMP kinase [symbiont of Argiope bruennichi]|uniref:uridine monophosphate kinase n=1 Tax=symbiont of Argiope bruennichi TaxID=2810479 RepID=UPI003DA647D7